MNHGLGEIVTIITAIIGVAMVAVLVSKNANTTGVISSSTSGLGYLLGVAVSPVTGNTPSAPMNF
jgi:hypothetical protein